MAYYAISELDDKALIHNYLASDPAYAAYALADLQPPEAEHSRWFAASRTGEIEGLGLVYSALHETILFLMGDTSALSALLMHGIGPSHVFFSAPSALIDVLPDFYRVDETLGLFRMRVTRGIFNPYIHPEDMPGEIVALRPANFEEMQILIAETSEADSRDIRDVAFDMDMLSDGYYCGLRIDGKLVAMAGTHIASKAASVAAMGNVSVHPDYRRHGYGGLVSQVVTEALLNDEFELVVLSVRQNNQAANKIYRRLGYKPMCTLIEGIAERY